MEYIYKITNIKNNKFYIGKSKDVNKRWLQHQSLMNKKRHPLYDSMLKYGVDSFIIEIIDKTTADKINELEKKWISKTNAINNGYNLTDGGTGGDTFSNRSEESKTITKEKHRQNLKNKNPMNNLESKTKWKNIISSEDYKNNMSKLIKNMYKKNPEIKSKISEGVKLALKSPKVRKKWSDCKKGKLNARWLGYVVITDLQNYSEKYESAVDAAKKLKTTAHNIREHCRNNTTFVRGPYAGWKFKFQK